MTTCPMCDTVRMVCIDENPEDKAWHVNCDCGWAWVNSGYFRTRKEAKIAWEKQLTLREEWSRHMAEAQQSRQ